MKYLVVTLFALASLGCSNKPTADFTGNWIEVMPCNMQIVQGVTLKNDGSAASIGMATLKYERWKVENESMILWGKSIGNGQTIDFTDTLSIVKVTPDSLILGKNGMYKISYYKVANPDAIKQ